MRFRPTLLHIFVFFLKVNDQSSKSRLRSGLSAKEDAKTSNKQAAAVLTSKECTLASNSILDCIKPQQSF